MNSAAPNFNIIHGVKKNGKAIDLLCRPTDNEKLVIHSANEIEILKKENYELWGDDGDNCPRIITFGEIIDENDLRVFRIRNWPVLSETWL